ncbi:MAG: type II toxin-antitoxin system HicA family toxin [Sodaliphilus sp.]|jgi:mRNA interferase HicA|nr:type II toxin-antitoxin system HicA family toxin [Sodaliphilus sp.]
MKTSKLIQLLSRNGCELERHGGRHDKWINRKTGASEWIPRHAAEVPKGLAEKILKKLVGE